MDHDQQQLQQAGYRVVVHSRYHWSVSKPGSRKVVSVWPTARKILVKYDPGPAPRYQGSMLKAVERCYAKMAYPPLWTPEQYERMGFVWELRERGLDVIRELMEI